MRLSILTYKVGLHVRGVSLSAVGLLKYAACHPNKFNLTNPPCQNILFQCNVKGFFATLGLLKYT